MITGPLVKVASEGRQLVTCVFGQTISNSRTVVRSLSFVQSPQTKIVSKLTYIELADRTVKDPICHKVGR